MTRERLERYRDLAVTIRRDEEELARLRSEAEHPGAGIVAGAGGTRGADRIGAAIARMEKLEKELERETVRLKRERAEIYRFCMGIRDLHIRNIVVWRVIDGYGYEKIARLCGGGNTKGSVKMAYRRFLAGMQ